MCACIGVVLASSEIAGLAKVNEKELKVVCLDNSYLSNTFMKKEGVSNLPLFSLLGFCQLLDHLL